MAVTRKRAYSLTKAGHGVSELQEMYSGPSSYNQTCNWMCKRKRNTKGLKNVLLQHVGLGPQKV